MRFLETSTFCVLLSCTSPTAAQLRFEDDFSGDLSKWVVVGDHAIGIRESNAEGGRFLEWRSPSRT